MNHFSKHKRLFLMSIVMLAVITYAARHSFPIMNQVFFGSKKICAIDANNCVLLKSFWVSPKFLESGSSIVAIKRSSLFSVGSIEKDFSNNLLISFVRPSKELNEAITHNYASLTKYPWGTLLKPNNEFHIKTANKYSVFGDFYYIPEIEGIITCKDISCLDDIVSLSKSAVP